MPHLCCMAVVHQVAKKYGVEKIKTIGDCYMCVGWAEEPDRRELRQQTAYRVLQVAQEMHYIIGNTVPPQSGHSLAMRAGINGGSVVSGIIGKTKFCFDIWGVCLPGLWKVQCQQK